MPKRISGRVRRLRLQFIRTLDKIQGSQRDHQAVVEHLEAGRDEAALAEAEDKISRRKLAEAMRSGDRDS